MQISDVAAVSKRRVYLAFLALALGLSIVPGGPKVPQLLWDLWRVASDPATTTGVVTQLDCGNHGHVDYVVRLGSTPIAGRRHNIADANCKELKMRQRVAIYYERAIPQNNFAALRAGEGNPAKNEFWRGVGTWATFVLLAPLFLVLVWTVFSRVAMATRGAS